jgi:hypothetical protein
MVALTALAKEVAMPTALLPTTSNTSTNTATVHPTLTMASRIPWMALAAACLGGAVFAIGRYDASLWALAFLIAPDLSFLAGVGQQSAPGQLPPRAVPVYNLVHRPVVPLLLLVVSLVGAVPSAWSAVALAWLAHISIDHAAGYGLRTRDGWQRG